MEACKTHEERAAYVRRLVRGIFRSDLPGVTVMGDTKLVYGAHEAGLMPIPEFEHMLDTWRDFPRAELATIIKEESARGRGEHLAVVSDLDESDSAAAA